MRALFLVALFASLPLWAAQPRGTEASELGLELVPFSKKVGERRYESPRDYDSTVKFFKDKFKGQKTIKWTREVSLPAVKYIHLESTSDTTKWRSVNIYEFPDRRVRYFILNKPKAAGAAKVDAKPVKATPPAPIDAKPSTP